MKNLAQRFLSDSEQKKVRSAVQDAETKTSGEIVPMVAGSSYDYPRADIIGATAFALPLALVLTPLAGSYWWIGSQNMWLFLAIFVIGFAVFYGLIENFPPLKRIFISAAEMEEEVREAAMTAFFKEGLYRTRDKTGVLIFISVFEKKVWVLADRAVNEKLGQNQWEKIVGHITEGIRQHRQADAICEAVVMIADMMKEHFPVRHDDKNELKNLIIDE